MKKEASNSIDDGNIGGYRSKDNYIELDLQFNLSEKAETSEDDDFVYIEGYASTDDKDSHGDIIPPDVWNRKALKRYKKNPIILFNHNMNKPKGNAIELTVDEKGLYVKCRIDKEDEECGKKVAKGILKTFSIGFYLLDFDYSAEKDAWIIKELELLEISIVSIPSNSMANFSLSKQLGGNSEVKRLRQKLLGNNQLDNSQIKDMATDKKSWFAHLFGNDATLEEAQEALKNVKDEKEALEVENSDLIAKNANLETELTEAKSKSTDLENELATEKETVTNLEASKADLETENETLKAEATATTENVKSLEAEIESLKAEIEKSKGIKTVKKDGQDPNIDGKESKVKRTPNADKAAANAKSLKI